MSIRAIFDNIEEYQVSLIENKNVSLLIDSNNYEPADIVAFDLKLSSNYKLKNIKILNENNEDVTTSVSYNSKTKSFTMPNYPVRISPTIEEISNPKTLDNINIYIVLGVLSLIKLSVVAYNKKQLKVKLIK